ncbi:hypothetical protein MESS4_260030 [Mesorhizobium sp. STM 4661]|nr:hypothetical protein MESS4_260030 [Mesorhizobium sp. STM 4661]
MSSQELSRLSFVTPPSVLPDISPARGEIGSFADGAFSAALAIGENGGDIRSPPLRGRCPAGQRGVGGNAALYSRIADISHELG